MMKKDLLLSRETSEYDLLVTSGNLGYYQSCEIIEIFAMGKSAIGVVNLYTIAVFQEKPYRQSEPEFLGQRIKFKSDNQIGIKRYVLTLQQASEKFDRLLDQRSWDDKMSYAKQKLIPKQYIPESISSPINAIIKNNFDGGSYILEFFDEHKQHLDLFLAYENRAQLERVFSEIQQRIPINLVGLRDRIGNIIFQFPITLVELDSKAMNDWNGVQLSFAWHKSMSKIPDCSIIVESSLDGNLMGYASEKYNKLHKQTVITNNLDGENRIRLERENPKLVLGSSDATYLKGVQFDMRIVNPEPRIFELKGEKKVIQIQSAEKNKKKSAKAYSEAIHNRLYEKDQERLRSTLSFKQYGKGATSYEEGIDDLRTLISRYDTNGVCLWDPYLSAYDILETLYHSPTRDVPLKAITSLSMSRLESKSEGNKKSKQDFINEYANLLNNPNHNNFGLNLEFRCRINDHGWSFHDRFLIFPGDQDKRARAYSLGTSVNSFGKEHHILQEVSNPQRIADAFEELWDSLNHPECLIWYSLQKK